MKLQNVNVKMDVLKLLVGMLGFALIANLGASTELNNIEKITPAGTQPINITGSIDMKGNPITGIGGLGGCGSNQFVSGDGTCTTDSYDPDTTIPDNQSLSISGHTISLDNGGSVTVPDNYEADTDNQGLSNVVSNGGSLNSGQTIDASSGAFRLPVGTDAY